MKQKFKESDLASILISYLDDNNYTTYKEVSLKGRGSKIRADIYATKDGLNISIETKMSIGLKVIEQGFSWQQYSNMSFICVPRPTRKTRKTYNLCIEICKKLNIGLFLVDMYSKEVIEYIKPTINTKPIQIPPLFEEQRNSEAGNDRSEYITLFKLTTNALNSYLVDKDNINLKEVISNIKHHYKNDQSAYTSLKKMIIQKVIKGLVISKDGTISKIK